jgi:dTDP-4-dehydrorhamnose reductase
VSRKILVTGARGQLGTDLVQLLSGQYEITGVDIDEVDIRDDSRVSHLLQTVRPEVVLHAAAFTDVDACESDRDTASAVNVDGTYNLARSCRDINARMIYYSTDYVFSGDKDSPYVETDPTDPRTVYGMTKLEGEHKIKEVLSDYAILRIAWLYGAYGKNFVKTMVRLGEQQLRAREQGEPVQPLKVVDDQRGNPTWTVEVALQTSKIIESDLTGVMHCTAEGETSWYGFARNIYEQLHMDVRLRPCATREFPRPAPRPARSSLENQRLKESGHNIMRDYKAALTAFLVNHGGALSE